MDLGDRKEYYSKTHVVFTDKTFFFQGRVGFCCFLSLP